MPCCNWRSAVQIYLDEELIQKSPTNKYLSMAGLRQFVMLLIFILKSVTDSMLPCGTPSSWFWISDNVVPMQTWNFLSERKDFIKLESLPFNPMLSRSFMIPYLQVVSYAFSRSKNIAKRCCFCIIASLMEVSNLTTWTIVDLWLLKPHWKLVKRLLDSMNQTSLLLTMHSIVLHRQLVKAIGW